MATCTRCEGRGRLTAHSVPCVGCNGTGEVGPFKERPMVVNPNVPSAEEQAFRAGYRACAAYAVIASRSDVSRPDLTVDRAWRKFTNGK